MGKKIRKKKLSAFDHLQELGKDFIKHIVQTVLDRDLFKSFTAFLMFTAPFSIVTKQSRTA